MPDKVKVTVLGATGLVGQWITLLASRSPWLEVIQLMASSRSQGRKYGEAAPWRPPMPLPDRLQEADVELVDPGRVEGELVLSALPSEVAWPVEEELARRGKIVVSNARPGRMEPDIPLVNPLVNHDHLSIAEVQHKTRGWRGRLYKNPNCSTAILTQALAPIHREFQLEEVHVTTLQAVSGAGIRGLWALEIMGNVIPFIKGEEEKMVLESRKILGELRGDKVELAKFKVYPTTTRVPVQDGHTESIHAKVSGRPGFDEVLRTLETYRSGLEGLGLSLVPERPIQVLDGPRPQPILDVLSGGGMTVSVGRLRVEDGWVRLVALGHNLVIGAAGANVAIAELLASNFL